MDIKQAPGATAVLTLGKDMTFRDYAQGAYRMRGIGKGQTIELFIIPEVENRMKQELGSIKGAAVYTGQAEIDVPAWLLVNSMRVESLHFVQMSLQELQNVWRKRALTELLEEDNTREDTCNAAPLAMEIEAEKGEGGKSTTSTDYSAEMRLLRYGALPSICTTADDELLEAPEERGDAQHQHWHWLRRCVHLFREQISHEVADGVPVARPFQEKVQEIVSANQDLLTHPQTSKRDAVGQIDGAARVKMVVAKLAIGQAHQEAEADGDGPSLVSEVVHENEQEEEAEEEAEEEEQKMSAFSRDDEQHNPWQAALLRGNKEPTAAPDQSEGEGPFYAFEQFQARPVQPKLAFPSRLMLTDNFFR
jgi:hypothetical protein